MNSNMCLFDEDNNLSFEDMEWNVDSMFSGRSPTGSDFDLSKETQDFLEDGGNVFHATSQMVLPTISVPQNGSDHISPRGIAENVEPESSCGKPKQSLANAIQASPSTPAAVSQRGRSSPQRPCLADKRLPEAKTKSSGDGNNNAETKLREASPQRKTLINVGPEESPIQTNEGIGGLNQSNDLRQQDDVPGQQVVQLPILGEQPDSVLPNETSIEINENSNEFSGIAFGSNNITSDPIESLLQLPDHIQYNGDLDAILHLQSIGTAAEDGETTQDFLFPMQNPQQELTNPQAQATHQIVLASNDVISNYEPSANYGTNSEDIQRTSELSPIPDAPLLLQAPSVMPGQHNTAQAPGIQLDNQTIQQVVQAYQSNIHPHLQTPLAAAHAPHGSVFTAYDANSQAPIATQPLHIHNYLASARPNQDLLVRPSEGIVKRRGRKKGARDPTKPPPPPRRRRLYNPRGKNPEQALGLSPSGMTSGTLSRKYTKTPVAQHSVAVHAASSSRQFVPQSRGRPPTSSVASGVPSSTTDEIQPVSGPGQSSAQRQALSSGKFKNASPSTPKAPGRVDSGRVTKKPGRKGGRINPETAHLSVEQRRLLRAKRNRESAEKSRVRRKVQTAELEMSVAELRKENKTLKSDALRFQAQLSAMSMEITQHAETPAEQEQFLREQAPALLQSLLVLRRVVQECPRTFRPHPHSPEIQLKIRR